MKKIFYSTLILAMALSVGSAFAQTPQPTATHVVKAKKTKTTKDKKSTSSEADGTSFDKAVLIQEKTEGKGEDAEYAWIAAHYPGYKTNQQSLNQHGSKPYDIINITTQQGQKVDVYFDISNFFGKF